MEVMTLQVILHINGHLEAGLMVPRVAPWGSASSMGRALSSWALAHLREIWLSSVVQPAPRHMYTDSAVISQWKQAG